jgi:hypothetical protein
MGTWQRATERANIKERPAKAGNTTRSEGECELHAQKRTIDGGPGGNISTTSDAFEILQYFATLVCVCKWGEERKGGKQAKGGEGLSFIYTHCRPGNSRCACLWLTGLYTSVARPIDVKCGWSACVTDLGHVWDDLPSAKGLSMHGIEGGCA